MSSQKAKLFQETTQVRCLGIRQEPGPTEGFPMFSLIKGSKVAMMREGNGKGAALANGRPEMVITADLQLHSRKIMQTKFCCLISHDETDTFIAKFKEGVVYNITFRGYPKREADGTYYRAPRTGVAIANMVMADLDIEPAEDQTIPVKTANKVRFAPITEMAPVVRASNDQDGKN
jgi:hypothetical protein